MPAPAGFLPAGLCSSRWRHKLAELCTLGAAGRRSALAATLLLSQREDRPRRSSLTCLLHLRMPSPHTHSHTHTQTHTHAFCIYPGVLQRDKEGPDLVTPEPCLSVPRLWGAWEASDLHSDA